LDKNVGDAYRYAKQAYERTKLPIDIFGYSRGAVAALDLANLLDGDDIPVRFVGLIEPSTTWLPGTTWFDEALLPYSRWNSANRPKIPSNVRRASIALASGRGVAIDHIVSSYTPETVDPRETTVTATTYKLDHMQAGLDVRVFLQIARDAKLAGVPFRTPPSPPKPRLVFTYIGSDGATYEYDQSVNRWTKTERLGWEGRVVNFSDLPLDVQRQAYDDYLRQKKTTPAE
jgi:hypothetical protein